VSSAEIHARGVPLVTRTVALDDSFPLAALLNRRDAHVWIRRGEGLVGWGRALHMDVPAGAARFEAASRWLEEVFRTAVVEDGSGAPGSGPLALAAFTFDPDEPGSIVVVPEVTIRRAGRRAWMTLAGAGTLSQAGPLVVEATRRTADKVTNVGSSLDREAWLEVAATALEDIEAGRLDKVVAARDLTLRREGGWHAGLVARRLEARFPECFTFSFDGMVGASPELLIKRAGEDFESMPLAGSAVRAADAQRDARIGATLWGSDKDRREHDITVASVAGALSPLSASIRREGPQLLRLANVQHLATLVAGKLKRPLSALELAGRLHPTAAVCGAPRRAAMSFIRTHEGFSRGRYGGPVGWVDADGDGEWAIALRCALLEGDTARLFAGAGIVAGSRPSVELEETQMKLEAMLVALGA
jgi:menaquinone-specific isochorismate synthase